MSIASRTVASSRLTLTVACGRATPTISAARATSRIATRHVAPPAGRPVDEVRQQAGRGPALGVVLPPALAEGDEPDEHRDHQQHEQRGGGREAQRALRMKATSVRSQSPDVERTTWRAPTEASSRATSRRSASAAAAKRSRSFLLRVSTRSWRPVSGSTSQSSPAFGRFCSRGIADLDGDDVVAAGELEQRRAPVARPAEVRHDDGEGALAGERARLAERGAERGRPEAAGRLVRLVAKRGEQPDEADAALAHGQHGRIRPAEGERAEAVPAAGGEVADGDRHALGDVRLPAVGGPEAHRRRRVEHEPGDEHALGLVDADVWLAGAGGDVPVDPAHVVARDIRADERELGAVAEERRAVVAGEHALHPAADRDVERLQQPVRDRPRAWTRAAVGARRLTRRSAPRGRAAASVPRRGRAGGSCPESPPPRAPGRRGRGDGGARRPRGRGCPRG